MVDENKVNENGKEKNEDSDVSEDNVIKEEDKKPQEEIVKEDISKEELEKLIKESGAEVINIDDFQKNTANNNDNMKKLENEVDTLKDRLVRLEAEYDNYRKRTSKEKEALYSSSVIDVIKEILPVLDTLEKSMLIETENVDEFKKGIDLTLDKFRDSLSKLGVEEIDTSEKFDPNFHDAVMHEKDDNYGEKEISEVFIKGYKKDDKIIRYSVVKVVN